MASLAMVLANACAVWATTTCDSGSSTTSCARQGQPVHNPAAAITLLQHGHAKSNDSVAAVSELLANESNPDIVVEGAINCAKSGTWGCGWADYIAVSRDVIYSQASDKWATKRAVDGYNKLGNLAKAASVAGDALHKLLDRLTEDSATRSKISIHNRLTNKLDCYYTHSYQMNLWDNQFPDLNAWEGKDVYIETSTNTWGWSDTNAEAYYHVYCPAWRRHLTFMIMTRHQRWIRFAWAEQDVYNPCFDMWIEGHYYVNYKCDGCYGYSDKWQKIASADEPILVVGSYEVYNKKTEVTLKLKPRQADSRYPVMYEHSNFHGIAHPIRTPWIRNLAGYNDKTSSLRVPPGMKVVLCEHAGFGGHCHTYERDIALVHSNDAATSAIWCTGYGSPWPACR